MDFDADGFEVKFQGCGTRVVVGAAGGGASAWLLLLLGLGGAGESAACVVEDFEFGEGGVRGGCCVGVLVCAGGFFVDGVVLAGAGAGPGPVACVGGFAAVVVVSFCGGGGGADEGGGGSAVALVGGLRAGFGAGVGYVELFWVLVYVCFGAVGVRTETGGFHEEATWGWSVLVAGGVIAVGV